MKPGEQKKIGKYTLTKTRRGTYRVSDQYHDWQGDITCESGEGYVALLELRDVATGHGFKTAAALHTALLRLDELEYGTNGE